MCVTSVCQSGQLVMPPARNRSTLWSVPSSGVMIVANVVGPFIWGYFTIGLRVLNNVRCGRTWTL